MKPNVNQGMVFKDQQSLPNNLSTPTVVPNLVAGFEARSSVHSATLRPHVITGPSISRPPTASGSRQVPKDSPSQEFPTVVPAALPSNSSSKSNKIPLPISGDVSAMSLERSSTPMDQKEKVHKDLTSSLQQLQGDLPKTVQPVRVHPVAPHVQLPSDKDETNYHGNHHQPYLSNAIQAPRVPNPEKRPEEVAHYNPAQSLIRPAAIATQEAPTSSNRTVLPIEVLPSTSSQRGLLSVQPHTTLPPSHDGRSGGAPPAPEDVSGTGHGTRPFERDTPHVIARMTPPAGVSKNGVIDARTSPLSVQEHKVGHGVPSPLPTSKIRASVELNNGIPDSRGSSEGHLPVIARASPRQSPKPGTNDPNSEGHFTAHHRPIPSSTHPSLHPSSLSKEREQGTADMVPRAAPFASHFHAEAKETGSQYSQDLPIPKAQEVHVTLPETYQPAIRHSKLAEILSSPLPAGRKDDLRPAPQISSASNFRAQRSRSESTKVPPQSSSHMPLSNTTLTSNVQDPAVSLHSLEIPSSRHPAGSLHSSPARGHTATNTPSSGNPPRVPSTASHTPSPRSISLAHPPNIQNSHTTGIPVSRPTQLSSTAPGVLQPEPVVVSSMGNSRPDVGFRHVGTDSSAAHALPQAQSAPLTYGNQGSGQPSQKVGYSAPATHPSATTSSNRAQAKTYNYSSQRSHRIDPSNTYANAGPSNSTPEVSRPDPNTHTHNAQALSQVASSQLPAARHQQLASLPTTTASAVASSLRTHTDSARHTVPMRDPQNRKLDPRDALGISTSDLLPVTGSRTALSSERVSRTPSENSTLKTPSSLAPSILKPAPSILKPAPSILKPTPSHTSIPASVSSQESRKKGLFGMFRTKATQPAPQKYEIWHPPSGTQNTDQKVARKADSPPMIPRNTDTKVIPSQANAPVAITVPITIVPSGRRSPNSKVFTPFRYLTSKRNRNVSAASVEAQDGTAVRFAQVLFAEPVSLTLPRQTPSWGLQQRLCTVNLKYKYPRNEIHYLRHRNGEGGRQSKHGRKQDGRDQGLCST
jgi:hypothetical protein